MIGFIFKLVLSAVVIFLFLSVVRTFQLEQSTQQKLFVKSKAPNPLPAGFYKGSVSLPFYTPWKGKTFNNKENTGINTIASKGTTTIEKYPFKTYTAKGLRDKTTDVFAIDYDIPQNPFFIRRIVDEIVEIEPGHYLGKLQVRLLPNHPFTFAYFELKK